MGKYPTIVRLWSDAGAEFVRFLSFDVEIRTVICSTNAAESVNSGIRKAVRARGHFPGEQAALKCVYMALMSLDPTGKGRVYGTGRRDVAVPVWRRSPAVATRPRVSYVVVLGPLFQPVRRLDWS